MLSVHNTRMYLKVMEDIRSTIADGTFAEFHREFVGTLRAHAKGLAGTRSRRRALTHRRGFIEHCVLSVFKSSVWATSLHDPSTITAP
jgi:hypothetical protein